ncbi:hypothetical protein [Flagellimonas eckloniae]|uniref:Uncharacterized protein n=1 Tax=Flagellimonas eckloniae TaxID=346185 RepID=A0A0Q1BZE6_9FLAO|nr:hypothetical protein [Allomuricauda eckloniae]KQC30185.1 hypothetical protein AAY42_10080 [Allomuricauda eckloniae]
MRKAVITITPDDGKKQLDCQTGNVSDIEILDALTLISRHFAQKLLEEYESVVGGDYENLDAYLDFLRTQKL